MIEDDQNKLPFYESKMFEFDDSPTVELLTEESKANPRSASEQ